MSNHSAHLTPAPAADPVPVPATESTKSTDPLICIVFLDGQDYEEAVDRINDLGGSYSAAAEHLANWDYGSENDSAARINGYTDLADVERHVHEVVEHDGVAYWVLTDHSHGTYALYRRPLQNRPLLDLDEIQARADAATPGPWYQGRDSRQFESASETFTRENMLEPDSFDVFPIAANAEDAAFVAHARTDIPALVAAVRDRDAEILALRADLKRSQRRRDTGDASGANLSTPKQIRTRAEWEALPVGTLVEVAWQTGWSTAQTHQLLRTEPYGGASASGATLAGGSYWEMQWNSYHLPEIKDLTIAVLYRPDQAPLAGSRKKEAPDA